MNALPVSHPHYPSPRTMSLPPLSKGGGLTASHKLSLCCVLLATRPPFYSLNFSAVKTEGLLYHPSLSTTSMPSLVKGEVLSPEKFGRLPEGLPHRHPLHCTNPLEPALSLENSHHPRLLMNALPVSHPHYPLPRTTTLASLVKGRWLDGKAQTIALLRFTCNTSAFLFTKLFCRQDGGIAIPPFAQHHIYAVPCQR